MKTPPSPSLLTGLKKIPISQGLVTLLHICEVLPTLQLPTLPEMLHQHRFHCIEQRVLGFHDALRVFHNVLRVFHNVL